MSIISALRTFLATYPGLAAGAPLYVDYLGPGPTEYAIVPLAGGGVLEQYISGARVFEYVFAFRSMESTADDLERLENSGFYEALADWLYTQSQAGSLPALSAGKTAQLIEAQGWAYLYEQGQSDTGVYQIQCRLVYKQDP
ncbi:MAG: hypothetical protein ACKOC5_08825 [Chloroflexota bacterium]